MCFEPSSSGNLDGDLIRRLMTGESIEGNATVQSVAAKAKKVETEKKHLSDERLRRSRMAGDGGAETSSAVSLAGLPLGRTKLGR